MLTKHDLSHMGRNKKETRLITSQPPLLSDRREEEKKKTTRHSKGREAQAMEDEAWGTLVPCRVWVNSSLSWPLFERRENRHGGKRVYNCSRGGREAEGGRKGGRDSPTLRSAPSAPVGPPG